MGDFDLGSKFYANASSTGITEVRYETLSPSVIDEINMWKGVLEVLTKGLPVPFNPTKYIDKIEQDEKRYNKDYSALKKCCVSISEINEVKYFKPMIFEIVNRINDLGNLTSNKIVYRDENV